MLMTEQIDYENTRDVRTSYLEVPKKNKYRDLLKFGIYMMSNSGNTDITTADKMNLLRLLENPIYKSGILAINDLDKWEFIRDFKSPPNIGISHCDDPTIREIMHKMDEYYDGYHSGGTIAYCLKIMQYLAKNEMPTIVYLRRREYLLFTESLKMNGKPLMKNNDMIREIASFL